MEPGESLAICDYFRSDVQGRLPTGELQRRQSIKQGLEAQYNAWIYQERHAWVAISQTNASFLGLDWSLILPNVKKYVKNQSVAFALLSELQLCIISPVMVNSYESRPETVASSWLYEQYRRYAIWVQDFGIHSKRYRLPLIEATATPCRGPGLLEGVHPNNALQRLLPSPEPTSAFRLIIFPQTRYSFIEDEIFHSLYPLPEEEVRYMSYSLLSRFQGIGGHYNALASPFTETFVQRSYDAKTEYSFFAAMYPVIQYEFGTDYESRKRSERFVSLMQQKNLKEFPKISQLRYSRRFDFRSESRLRAEMLHGHSCPERIQSGRALFEYACPDFDTLRLDRQQVSWQEGAQPHLLVIEPLWLLGFPESNTLCAFPNDQFDQMVADPFKEIFGEQSHITDWGQALLQIVEKADSNMGSYKPMYRRRLTQLQFRIHAYAAGDHALIKNLSDFIAELTILLDPLQAQTILLRRWQEWHLKAFPSNDLQTHSDFEKAIRAREEQLDALKDLQLKAEESQSLLFQLSNTKTALLQAELARDMAQETRLQVKLARKAERQNKSILVFTIITVIFLPLSFFSSYFGMNTSDIRETQADQRYFWAIAGPISAVIVISALLLAFCLNANGNRDRKLLSDSESSMELRKSE